MTMPIVRDLMVPVVECGTVDQEMTVCEAIKTLAETQFRQQSQKHVLKYPALLVTNKDNRVVGKLGRTDMVANMDPVHRRPDSSNAIAHTSTCGISPKLLKALVQHHCFWNQSFEQRRRHLLSLKVKDCMGTPHQDEYVLESDSMEVAIHKLVIGRYQTLLVREVDGIVGILRLADVFDRLILQCSTMNTPDR